MKRMAQLSLPKRAITYYWKGIHPVSGARDTTCFQLEINDKAQTLRKQIKELSSQLKYLAPQFSQAHLDYCDRKRGKKVKLSDKDILLLRDQQIQYQKELYKSFFELIKLAKSGTITLVSEDLLPLDFEYPQNLAFLNKNNIQAFTCRQLIKMGEGDQEVLTTLATCIELGAQIEEEDLYDTSLELMQIKEIELIADNRKQLASELRIQAQDFKPYKFR